MAKPQIDAAQSAEAMIANIDRVIQRIEQQVQESSLPRQRVPTGAPAPAGDAAPPSVSPPSAAPPAPPAPAPTAPGGYSAPPAPPQAESAAPSGAFGGYAAPPPPAAAPAPPRARPLEDLDVFVSRLRQFKEWLQQDPRLLAVVDEYIGQRVQKMEARQTRQNVRLAIITTVAGAILGWLTSLAGTPTMLMHLLIR